MTKNFEVYTAEEFVAAITQHIPEKSFQMIRYYGWYSSKTRGIRRKKGIYRPGDEPNDEIMTNFVVSCIIFWVYTLPSANLYLKL